MHADLTARILKIEALLDIERLIYSYGHVLDFGNAEDYVALFVMNGVVEIQSSFRNHLGLDDPIPYEAEGLASGGRRTEKGIALAGRAALRRFASARSATVRGMHVASQPIIQLTGPQSGSAVSYMRVLAQAVGAAPELTNFGRYLDRFTLTESGWKFAERICEV
jgi:hypothetical protein